MPLALLLSPDDQAVSAITAVLEEMSVTCERPLDGVSAAQKINSHSFDLVLVDCENLPAAKLIFDVCRRGKGGNNPVPIAIVDGRAGLPTAFRLGAELILTKPVAKDQARSTIRTAVSRVKKEEPARARSTADQIDAASTDALQIGAVQPNAGQRTHESSVEPIDQTMPEECALAATAAAGSSQPTSFSDPAPVATLSAPVLTTAATMSAPVAAPEVRATPAAEAPSVVAESKPSVPREPSDDPVLAELEEAEAQPQPPVLSSKPQSHNKPGQSEQGERKQDQKTRGPVVAVLVLLLAGAGFYAAWMYEPGFRAVAQPQIDRVLALAGVARQPQPPARTPVKPAAQPTKVLAPANSADSAQSSQRPAINPGAAATAPATISGAAPASSPYSATSTSATAASATRAMGVASTAADKSDTHNNGIAAAHPSDAELPGEKTAVILSSKGADKRLLHSVQPTYPTGGRPAEAEGTMVLKAVVDENGNVASARVIEGNAALAPAAISAVKQWRYRPYVRDGKALPFQTVVLVDFQRP